MSKNVEGCELMGNEMLLLMSRDNRYNRKQKKIITRWVIKIANCEYNNGLEYTK